jgi:hypothetical protein
VGGEIFSRSIKGEFRSLSDDSLRAQIACDRQVAACQFLKRADSRFTVIDRIEFAQVRQFGQLACIDAVVLVPGLEQGILTRITDQHLRDVGLEKIVPPSGTGALFEGQMQLPRRPWINWRIVAAFVSRMDSPTCRRNPELSPRSLPDEHPAQYTGHHSRGCSRLQAMMRTIKNLLQKGRLL